MDIGIPQAVMVRLGSKSTVCAISSVAPEIPGVLKTFSKFKR